jgi:glucokinase
VAAGELDRLLAAGDPRVLEAVSETARWLGVGLAAAAALLDPEVIVVGGGVARLGHDAALLGAAFLAWRRLAAGRGRDGRKDPRREDPA